MTILGANRYKATRSYANKVSDLAFAKQILKFGKANSIEKSRLIRNINVKRFKVWTLKKVPKFSFMSVISILAIFQIERSYIGSQNNFSK